MQHRGRQMNDAASRVQANAENSGPPAVAVLIVSFNAREDLGECLCSIFGSRDMRLRPRIIVVDNASTDGSAAMVREDFPDVELIQAGSNIGFAAGNNLGWSIAKDSAAPLDYLYLLNQDTVVSEGWLEQAVAQLERNPRVGCGQSIVCLYADRSRLNTRGNVSHFLGFGFVGGYMEPYRVGAEQRRELGAASGAAMIVRCQAIEKVGFFQDPFFMYLEDVDLSWAIRIAGYQIESIPESVVYHKYAFKGDFRHYYHLEKNRLWLLLTFYRRRTLVLLLPAILFMEAGQFLFAATRGQLWAKLRSYGFLARACSRRIMHQRRQCIQSFRTIPDRSFLSLMTGSIQSPQLRGWLIRGAASPILAAYLRLLRCLVWW